MKRIIFCLVFLPLVLNSQVHKNNISMQGLTCSTCHSCDIPTKENPCIKPCPRESIIRIDQKAEEAPRVITINRIKETDIYQPVVFSHFSHAEMSYLSGGCRTCHHYNPPGNVIGCSDCHELSRIRKDIKKPDLKGAYHQQCMSCHRAWSGSTECKSCHLEKTDKSIQQTKSEKLIAKKIHPVIETPDKVVYNTNTIKGKYVTFYHNDHVGLFGFDCSDCHTNESCIKCHSLIKTPKKKPLKQDHKLCSDCHDTKNNCTSCHSNKEMNRFDHKLTTGFDSNKFHSKISCNRCHTTKAIFKGLNKGCASCHGTWSSDNFKHSLTGLVLDEMHAEVECESCHKEKTYINPICTECHDNKTYPKDKPGKLIKKQ